MIPQRAFCLRSSLRALEVFRGLRKVLESLRKVLERF